jgi:glycogen debranching enzyme
MDPEVGTFFRAGGGYEQPWTRDASVNAWNAGSLLAPDVARNTLWSVVTRQDDGALVVQQDDQWWDQVIWVPAAWNHYLVTGDREFLVRAYATAVTTLSVREAGQWNADHGLFMGPSFLNDGIAGYPDALLGSARAPGAPDADDAGRSFVLDHEGTATQLALSTNALYHQAYVCLAAMAGELGEDAAAREHARRAARLAASVNRSFWQPGRGSYGYTIPTEGPAAGVLQDYQEGAGLAFAVLFGIAGPARARSIAERAHVSPHGIVDVHPRFDRYAAAGHAGRHNDVVWPVVQGFWADAMARSGSIAAFAAEVTGLAGLYGRTGSFYEIYDATTGAVDGGYQTGRVWQSQPEQTWSASAYLRMIHDGLVGLRPTPRGLGLAPVLPVGWGDVTLGGLRYRDAELTVRLRGSGDRVTAFALDGVEQPRGDGARVPADLSGEHTVDLVLAGGARH